MLTSGVYKRFLKCFVLDEDSLRRIHGVLEKEANALGDKFIVVFHIEREDDRFYETTSVDEVLSDSNVPGREIRVLSIEIRDETEAKSSRKGYELVAQVVYTIEERNTKYPDRNEVKCNVYHKDRSRGLLLSDELEPQIQRTLKAKSYHVSFVMTILIPMAIAIPLCFKYLRDITLKTFADYILPMVALLIALVVASKLFYSLLGRAPGWYVKLYGPESAFLWGESQHIYASREKLRGNFFWAIVVSFIVSFVASGVWYFV